MNLRGVNKLSVAILLVVLAAGGVVVAISFQPSGQTGPAFPATWDEILAQASKEGSVSIFVDNELEFDEFLEAVVIPEFEATFGISVELETGHWSGVTQTMISERLGGRSRGSFDIVLLGDEAMGRALDSRLIMGPIDTHLEKAKEIEPIFRRGVQGIPNDGYVATISIDQYVLVGNEFFLEAALREEGALPLNATNLVQWLVEQTKPKEGVFPGRFIIPAPALSQTGAAFVMLAIYDSTGYEQYAFNPFDSSLESNWDLELGFLRGPPRAELEIEVKPVLIEEEDIMKKVAEGSFWLGYVRHDLVLSAAIKEGLDENLVFYFPDAGTIVSGAHAGIPFNAPRPSAALLFIDSLLSEEVQVGIVRELHKLPSLQTLEDDQLPAEAVTSQAWIPRDAARERWLPWPHFQYKVDLLALWRGLSSD